MMLLTTISFFLSSLLPLLLPSHSFCLRMVLGYSFKSSSLFMCAEKTLVRLRSATSERPFFTITQCWNISTGDPTPLPYEPYQATNVEIRANEITIHSCLRTKRFLLHF
ncbi:unnamed protein product [Brassica rapa subsp. trilocularis]